MDEFTRSDEFTLEVHTMLVLKHWVATRFQGHSQVAREHDYHSAIWEVGHLCLCWSYNTE